MSNNFWLRKFYSGVASNSRLALQELRNTMHPPGSGQHRNTISADGGNSVCNTFVWQSCIKYYKHVLLTVSLTTHFLGECFSDLGRLTTSQIFYSYCSQKQMENWCFEAAPSWRKKPNWPNCWLYCCDRTLKLVLLSMWHQLRNISVTHTCIRMRIHALHFLCTLYATKVKTRIRANYG